MTDLQANQEQLDADPPQLGGGPRFFADYAATGQRMTSVRARLAAMTSYAQLAAETSALLLAAHAATMEMFLDRLDRESGGAAAWFVAAGASPATK